jgi:hypothetical protein
MAFKGVMREEKARGSLLAINLRSKLGGIPGGFLKWLTIICWVAASCNYPAVG